MRGPERLTGRVPLGCHLTTERAESTEVGRTMPVGPAVAFAPKKVRGRPFQRKG
jgi:hypothetical protein